MDDHRDRVLVWERKHWIMMLVAFFVFGFVLFQYPVIGYFNVVPGQVHYYILVVTALYIVVTAVFAYILIGQYPEDEA